MIMSINQLLCEKKWKLNHFCHVFDVMFLYWTLTTPCFVLQQLFSVLRTFSLFQNLFRFNQWDIIGHRTLCVLHHQLVNMLLSIYWKQLLHVYIRNTICAVHYCLQAYLWEDLEQNCSFFLLHKCCTYMYVNSQKPFNHHTVSVLSWRPVH